MFVNVLTHELKTPLTPIMASSGILLDLIGESSNELQKRLITNLRNGAETLCNKLEELLDLARHSRGTFKIKRKPIESISGESKG
jgi:K+-sensing histidine kinase KdpD